MVNVFKVASLGTPFVQDPAVSLINYIKNNWDYPEVPVTLNTDSISLNAGLGQIHGYKYASFPVGQINGMALDVKVAAGNIRVKLYSDVSGIPTTLVTESDVVVIGGTGTQRINFETPYVNKAITDLWFMYEYDDGTARFGGANSGTETYETHTFGAGPTTWATTGTLSQTTWMTVYYQPLFAILKERCYFNTTFSRADSPNIILVSRVTKKEEENSLGMSRVRYYDFFAIQLACKGENATNHRFLIEERLEDLINANPIAERVDGFDEFKITGFAPINVESDDYVSKSIVDTTNTQLSRSKALVTVIYDKYLTSS